MTELVEDWRPQGNCAPGKGVDPDALFVVGAEQNRAKRICIGCVVRLECLADALDNGIEIGVWGGMTERERRALKRRHPDIDNWWNLFEEAARKSRAAKSAAETGEQSIVAPALGDRALDAVTPPVPPMLRPDTDQTL